MTRQRSWWWLIGLLTCPPLLCCGVCGGLFYWYGLLHIYSYEADETVLFLGKPLEVDIRPNKRLARPDRLVGPPYEVRLDVADPTGIAESATLVSMAITTEDGSTIPAKIVNARREITVEPVGRTAGLYGQFEVGDWGTRPKLVVEVRLSSPGGVTSQTVTIPLRSHHRTEFYIP